MQDNALAEFIDQRTAVSDADRFTRMALMALDEPQNEAEGALAASEDALIELGVQVERIQSPHQHIDLINALRALAERQITSVLLESGSRLNAAFLASDLVDEVDLFYADAELGHGAVPFAEGGPSPYLLEQRLSRLSKAEFGSDTLVTGYLRDPWGR